MIGEIYKILFNETPSKVGGQISLNLGTPDATQPMGALFYKCTDSAYSPNGSNIPDVLFNQASDVTLLGVGDVSTSLRTVVSRFDYSVTGATAWTTGTSLNIKYSDGQILVGIPLVGLGANMRGSFPWGDVQYVPNTVTVTGGASTTTVVNLASTPFVAKATCSLVGAYVMCASGTAANVGRVRQITDHNTTSFTVGDAFPAAPAASDTFYVYSHQAVATTNATTLTANDTLVTSTLVGYYTYTVSGTGLGQGRQISANTGSALTVGTMATAPDTSTAFMICNQPNANGVMDFGQIAGHRRFMVAGSTLVATLVGSFGAGSPVRLYIQGYYNGP